MLGGKHAICSLGLPMYSFSW